MFERLPPTQTLRAFEAAARLGNYTRAGEELHLTHSAISHQIRSLEQRIGRKLFQREGRQMMLTDGGRLLAEEVRQALLALDRTLQIGKVERQQAAQTLRVSVSPSFASAWLVPRLAAFHQRPRDPPVRHHRPGAWQLLLSLAFRYPERGGNHRISGLAGRNPD